MLAVGPSGLVRYTGSQFARLGSEGLDLCLQLGDALALLCGILIELCDDGSILRVEGCDLAGHLGLHLGHLGLECANNVFYFHCISVLMFCKSLCP